MKAGLPGTSKVVTRWVAGQGVVRQDVALVQGVAGRDTLGWCASRRRPQGRGAAARGVSG